ncbi:MAG TPA: GAF domain-containing sensor histidine kinase [Aggregatilineales bacterium]|jgi:signal transduction histidine kinase|nr:GAF domain-containing sensor histidine kinase [Aggregatilineales bacterium]
MDQTRYIHELEARVAVLTRLVDVNTYLNGAILSGTPRIESLLSYIMDVAADITDCESASVLLWRPQTQELFFAATKSDNEQARALIGKPVPLDSIAGNIFTSREPVQVDDTGKDPRHYNKVDQDLKFVTRSLLGVPMVSKGRPIGVLEVVNKRSLPWSGEDTHNLLILAEEAAVVIEVAQLVLALQKANAELSRADKIKSDFIAIASHELRTPLGVILGYASFLQDEANSPEVMEHANKVMESALQLRRIIEDMVNLHYLKQSESQLMLERTTLARLINDLVDESRQVLEGKRHTLVIDLPEAPIALNVDRARVNMALNNILNNAMRFTPEGGTITIRGRVHANREARITVEDSGIGMEKHQLDRIFEEFYQVEDHMTRVYGGLGIGLSIARELIRAHNGRIWAESAGIGSGSSFIVALPLAK